VPTYEDNFSGAFGVDTEGVEYPLGQAHLSENPELQWTVVEQGATLPSTGSDYDIGATHCCPYFTDPECDYCQTTPIGTSGLTGGATGSDEAVAYIELDCNEHVTMRFAGGVISGVGLVFNATGRVRVTYDEGTATETLEVTLGSETRMFVVSPAFSAVGVSMEVFTFQQKLTIVTENQTQTITDLALPNSNRFGVIAAAAGGLTPVAACPDSEGNPCDPEVNQLFPTGIAEWWKTHTFGSCAGPGGETGPDGQPLYICAWWRSDMIYQCVSCVLTGSQEDPFPAQDLNNSNGYGFFSRMPVGVTPVDLSAYNVCGDPGGSGCSPVYGDPADLYINDPSQPDADPQNYLFYFPNSYGPSFDIPAIRQPAMDTASQPPVPHPFVSPTFEAAEGWTVWNVVNLLASPVGELASGGSIFDGDVELLWSAGTDIGLAADKNGLLIAEYGGTQVQLKVQQATNCLLMILLDYDPATSTLRLFERSTGSQATATVSSPPTSAGNMEILKPAANPTEGFYSAAKDWLETIPFCGLRSAADNDATLEYLIARYAPPLCVCEPAPPPLVDDNNVLAQRFTTDPVNTRTGNYTYIRSDFAIPSRGPAPSFVRAYNSVDDRVTNLGSGWTNNYATRVRCPGDGSEDVLLVREDGLTDRYISNGDGTYSPPAWVQATLIRNADGSYRVTKFDQTVHVFDALGNLASIIDRFGNQSVMAYNLLGQLVSISDPAGRGALTLAYHAISGLLAA